MFLFNRTDQFQIIPGKAPIVVGAPHDGTRPNVNADIGTGSIAIALASKLEARAVIVRDLRHIVDVNKNPADMSKSVVGHALRYQNEIFAGFPNLIIEIHGHVSGQYPVEITSGFDLNPDAPGDAAFLERLRTLKRKMSDALAGKLGQMYPVGVYPLDRDVKKTATNTFTFQKIRRARNLTGREWYGLHIEFAAEFRTTKQSKSKEYIDALTNALESSIRFAFEPLPETGSLIPVRADMMNSEDGSSPRIKLKVIAAAENAIDDNAIVVHPSALEALDALNGDEISLINNGEELRTTTKSSISIGVSEAAIPARIRRQLNVNLKDTIVAKKIALRKLQPTETQTQNRNFIISEIRPENGMRIWMHPEDVKQIKAGGTSRFSIKQHNMSIPIAGSITLETDSSLARKATAFSTDLAKKRMITIGEVFAMEADNEI